jgi:hypothetical protein
VTIRAERIPRAFWVSASTLRRRCAFCPGPLSVVMYLGSKVLGHIVSEHSELQLWGATLSTIFFVSSARSAEAGLHHGLDRLIEHVITKIGNP